MFKVGDVLVLQSEAKFKAPTRWVLTGFERNGVMLQYGGTGKSDWHRLDVLRLFVLARPMRNLPAWF